MGFGCALTLSLLFSNEALAWGPLGHRMVAETAAIILARTEKSPSWGEFLARHRFQLGFYSMIPDTVFRKPYKKDDEIEAPTHYFDVDIVHLQKIPDDFQELRKQVQKVLDLNLPPAHSKIGSAPWRIDQLSRTVRDGLKNTLEIKGGYRAGVTLTPSQKQAYDGLLNLGILSHYTGDATMPYHARSDWNGWKTGQGGVHFYFENDCVDFLEPGLSTEVLEAALKNRSKWLAKWTNQTILHVAITTFEDSNQSADELARLDRTHILLAKSDETKKQNAKRKSTAVGCTFLRSLLVERLALASVFTEFAWEQALPGKTQFDSSDPLQFSDLILQPNYIAPDYLFGSETSPTTLHP